MLSFKRGSKTVSYGAIIDVGSGSVGVGILKSDQNEKLPEILFMHRELIRNAEGTAKQEDIARHMREALFSATLVLSKEGLSALRTFDTKAKISRILVTCSSPWAYTLSKKTHYTDKKEFKVTEALINELTHKAETEIEKELEQTSFLGSLGLKVVERATVATELNGYVVHNPINLTAQTLSLSQVTGLVPDEILAAVHEVQEKILTNTEISTHTYMLVAYCVFRDLFPKQDSFTIIDVAGESTEIGIVQNGVLLRSAHTSYGSSTLVRSICKKTKSPPEDVLTFLRALTEKTAKKELHENMTGHLLAYSDTLKETLTELQKDGGIPNTIILTALPQLESLFKIIIPEITEVTVGSKFSLLNLKRETVEEIAIQGGPDIFISIASRFCQRVSLLPPALWAFVFAHQQV